MIIHPIVIVTPDFPTIKFKQPKDQTNLDLELPKILRAQGWLCGTYFNVQFVSHNEEKLLSSALYVVSEAAETLQTNEANPYQPITKTMTLRKAERIGEWWVNEDALNEAEEEPVQESSGAKITWNPGKKVHQLKLGDDIIFESANKEEVEKVAEAA